MKEKKGWHPSWQREQHECSSQEGHGVVWGETCKNGSSLRAPNRRWGAAGDEAGKVATGQATQVLSSLPDGLALPPW